ncbi:hypothetical protein A15D_00377 [Alcanivorax sp. MD8A]|uniref:hypothetical protein n=1 Tax=Alcanivorax sp. MD8A TaxID=1177157 RepID=UPI000C9C10A1|nr:hypothetical protein [Alcanivorax sp. MD8A]PNE04197.1 hypothetical protein A15D_00377 [Alcanivorax sp. MD8A]
MRDRLIQTSPSGEVTSWVRKNLIEVEKKEEHLEAVLAEHWDLLCLEDVGVFTKNVHVVRQASAKDITGAQKYPDILFLTDSGHVGVVEVKRYSNPELAGRKVVSQILDYGATITTLPEPDQVRLFRGPGSVALSFEELVGEVFSDCRNASALAARLARQLKYGQLHYIIACDRAPDGLSAWIKSISQSDATDFSVSVVEVSPYQREEGEGGIIWFSAPKIKTETIQRTTICFDVDSSGNRVNVFLNSEVTEEGVDVLSGGDDEKRITNFDRFQSAEQSLSSVVSWGDHDLYSILKGLHNEVIHENWDWVYDGFSESEHVCFLRGKRSPGFVEGRYGVNWLKPWRPSLFAGVYFYGWDHGLETSEEAGDFAIILDVDTKWGRDSGFYDSAQFQDLMNRLGSLNDWKFEKTQNRYHPIMIRKPMSKAFQGVSSVEGVKQRWLDLAKDGLNQMLSGGELVGFRQSINE